MSSTLGEFSQPVREWFAEAFGQPTPPQEKGWPPIQRGEHTLILAPTGSGKTLTAFLWGIDRLFREAAEEQPAGQSGSGKRRSRKDPSAPEPGVRLLYISPLKALNNDIQRNLRTPLSGIRKKARSLGLEWPDIRVAVRSGDTPTKERAAMLRSPPQILITTPESLYLLLTSPKAKDMLRTVRTVIVDEIHVVAGDKRGAHLALSLERLQHLAQQPIQRIGLSATIRPLDEVAHFLGGNEWRVTPEESGDNALLPRPVTIVKAQYEKGLDLQVRSVTTDFRNLPGKSIWPTLTEEVLKLIGDHDTTLVFTNSRRQAERMADWLNQQHAAEAEGEPSPLIEDGLPKGIGFFGGSAGAGAGPFRAHHGSISKEARLEIEQELKAGNLPALVGTSSLELGIDIGSVDLVVQLQAPKSVAQGLQRVGRSGHLVGQTSKGRILPVSREEALEAAALAEGMLAGEVEAIHIPSCPLDVLAQQIVAMVSVETWDEDELYDLVRRCCSFETLTPRVFQNVLEMLGGRYPSELHRQLRPRIVWDRINRKLQPLPGSRMMAVAHPGTITDRGMFRVYLSDEKTLIGELDEEFVHETYIGDAFVLGSQIWRAAKVTEDRVIVQDAPEATPRMPFWRGDLPWRHYELGIRLGRFRGRLAEELREIRERIGVSRYQSILSERGGPEVAACLQRLRERYALDDNSAELVVEAIAQQLDEMGAVSSDRTLIIETFDDALGDTRVFIHSPFGGRVNGAWGTALANAFSERLGVKIEWQSNDDGILFRVPEADTELPLDAITSMSAKEARERILRELPASAAFGARFRQNASRALLLSGGSRGRRTPFWLQRIKSKDLLQIAGKLDDFPIVIETIRDCVQDVMDLPHLEEVLGRIRAGEIEVVKVESMTPSSAARNLLWNFMNTFVYEGDAPRGERQIQALSISPELLEDLLGDAALDSILRPEAIEEVGGRMRRTNETTRARTAQELASLFQDLGDLTDEEVANCSASDPAPWVAELAGEGRLVGFSVPTASGRQERWVFAEYAPEYVAAFPSEGGEGAQGDEPDLGESRERILTRYLRSCGPVTAESVRTRYAFPESWLRQTLDRLADARDLYKGHVTPPSGAGRAQSPRGRALEYIDRRTLEQIHRQTLSILRREVRPVSFAAYADFLIRWQHVHPADRLSGDDGLRQVIDQLRAFPAPAPLWERDILPARLDEFEPEDLAAVCQSGEIAWVAGTDPSADDHEEHEGSMPSIALSRLPLRLLFRGDGHTYLAPAPDPPPQMAPQVRSIYEFLQSEGAVFFTDICSALNMGPDDARSALRELVSAGLVTNDSIGALHDLLADDRAARAPAAGRCEPTSSLEAQLAEIDAERGVSLSSRRAARSRLRRGRGRREVARKMREKMLRADADQTAGRWSLVHRFRVMGKEASSEEVAAARARQLLLRYGVVTRRSLDHEAGNWNWQSLLAHYRVMELRGQVRRGHFVEGLPGPQFASGEAVERLRRVREELEDSPGGPSCIVLNACDPANPYHRGMGDSVSPNTAGVSRSLPRTLSSWLVLDRGLVVLVAESNGSRLSTLKGADPTAVQAAVGLLADRLLTVSSRITVKFWDGQPVLKTEGAQSLESVGFYRDYSAMSKVRSP